MSEHQHPYFGRSATLVTMHNKEKAIAPPLFSKIGLKVFAPQNIDTDQLGTFTGEIPRQGKMLEVAIKKARLAMTTTGIKIGLASEGTFGPHPAMPFLPAGIELLVLVDDERDIIVHESMVVEETNFSHHVVPTDGPIEPFLQRVGFPEHGLVVRPNAGDPTIAITKGVVELSHLTEAMSRASVVSPDSHVRLETDMRAHLNPKRMKSLEVLATRLAQRLTTFCPACGMFGFGRTGTRAGLLCEDCGSSTEMIAAQIFTCPSCKHYDERPRIDGRLKASAQYCPECNP